VLVDSLLADTEEDVASADVDEEVEEEEEDTYL